MNEVIYILAAVSLALFSFLIKSWVDKKYPEGKHPINMMIFAVTFALILAGVINAVAGGDIPVSIFFIIYSVMFAAFIFYGLKHRNDVVGKMRRTYARLLVSYSYVFAVCGVLMAWFVPFMPNINL